MSVFDTVRKIIVGNIAHDAVDSGNPIKTGGKASSAVPTAVANGDRVDSYYDLNGRLCVNIFSVPSVALPIKGSVIHGDPDGGNAPLKIGLRAYATPPAAVDPLDVANGWCDLNGRQEVDINSGGAVMHDAADTGYPIKTGGKASTSLPAAVSDGDRVNAYYDQYGRQVVVVGNVAYNSFHGTAADPSPTGTDITKETGGALPATHYTIRDNTAHYWWIPMGLKGYRTLSIYIKNHSSIAWDQVPTIALFGAWDLSSSARSPQLLQITGVVTLNNRLAIGSGDVGVGGLAGTSPVPGSMYWYPVTAILSGFPYIALSVLFATGPTAGELSDVWIFRQAL